MTGSASDKAGPSPPGAGVRQAARPQAISYSHPRVLPDDLAITGKVRVRALPAIGGMCGHHSASIGRAPRYGTQNDHLPVALQDMGRYLDAMSGKPKAMTEQAICRLLDRYACPTPFHVVRTRFLGSIASPNMITSPVGVIEDLWGGELPVFDSIDDANELLGALVQGLWNDLTKHQKRSHRFRLQRLDLDPSAKNLGALARVRREELDGFLDGLFGDEDNLDLPERAGLALNHLSELRAMMAGIEDLVARDVEAESRTALAPIFKHLREMTRIMEAEIHEAVLSCARARRQMSEGLPTPKPSLH